MDEKGTPAQPTTKILRTDFGLIVALDDTAQTITISDAAGLNLMRIKVLEGTIQIQSAVQVVLEAPLIQHGQGADASRGLRRPAAELPEPVGGDVQLARASGRDGRRISSGDPGAAGAAISAGDAEPDLDEEPGGVTNDEYTQTRRSGLCRRRQPDSVRLCRQHGGGDGGCAQRASGEEGNPTVPVDNSRESRDRRIMFLAIAKGVIDHLVANEEAFQIRDNATNTVLAVNVNILNE